MNEVEVDSWAFKWSKTGLSGVNKFMAVFKSKNSRSNILYSYEEVNAILKEGRHCAIPKNVLSAAVYEILNHQVTTAA